MALLSDIREVKALMDIDPGDVSEDRKLNFLIEQASAWIVELLDRGDFSYQARTEFYRGTGTQRLNLRFRPVDSSQTLSVWVDEGGYFGAASGSFATSTLQTYGTDYCLEIDQPDGVTSRCGILRRIRGVWPQPYYRRLNQWAMLTPIKQPDTGSIKITYTGGYSVDNLPAQIRQACDLLVTRMAYLFPLGMELGGESYEERNISLVAERKDYMLALVKPLLSNFRNWTF